MTDQAFSQNLDLLMNNHYGDRQLVLTIASKKVIARIFSPFAQ